MLIFSNFPDSLLTLCVGACSGLRSVFVSAVSQMGSLGLTNSSLNE
uniref:Uncharacterized protein n=1 Tax=Arundo donax TaxID=35708 RepID=A0A0A8Y4E4_ARUDO